MNTLQEAAIKEYVNSIIKTYEDMYLDQRKKYSLDFKTEYIETKQMGYENRLDLDRILLDFETLDKFKKFVYDAEFDQYLTVEEAAERKLKVTA